MMMLILTKKDITDLVDWHKSLKKTLRGH
jgi:hypothetical protein